MSSKGELEGAQTLPPEDAVDSAPAPNAPPVGKWDRYELLDLLGRGGMGVVYKARDRRLDRTVAIKFILGADPNLTMRFLREARAQARIDHPNICRVYEVGEVQGRAYIAIQLIDGEPLGRAAQRMSLDEKVAVMRDVALAIHEAHRLGIVHRDLKPGNVMVERTDDGRWLPIVMDFGLAREATLEAGLTESGALIGTPAYMSPEQARGDVRAVDRRSDVYSLGATLYELMTGRPPFPNSSLALALAQVIHDDAPAPRRLVPSLPLDLETIALKCLAKEPGQRYASARSLADDLSRYLDGEPILGRRPPLLQRLRTSARRHRALFALGAWSTAIIIALGAFGLRGFLASRRERARTVERTRLAERLGLDANEIAWLLRAAYQLPLHDTRPEREVIRARMRLIAGTRHDLGALGDAVVHEALGRGHLALHEWQKAADELARAAAAGLDTPELHAARGRALGELYHRSLEEARRSGDKSWLLARQKELEARYLSPALGELTASRAAGDSAALLDALVPLYRRDFATAEARALAAAARSPWLFEARKLAGDAAYAAAMGELDHGRYDAARLQLEHATTLYGQASEVARSDASVYEAAAETWLARAELDFRQGRAPAEALTRALAVVESALTAAPDDAGAWTTKAYVLLLCFRARYQGAGHQRALLDELEAAARRATEIEPRDANAWDALGNAHVYRGTYEAYHGGKGDPFWRRSLDEFARALALRPDDPWANNDVGVAHRWLGSSLDDAGGDPMPEYRAALAAYEHATHVDPEYVYAWSNQADIEASVAEYQNEHGVDPRAAVDGARRAAERGLAVDRSFYVLYDTVAKAQLSLVDYLVESGGDPSAPLAATRAYLDRADEIHAENMTTWYYRALAARLEARFALRHGGGDPRRAIADGRAAIAAALRLAPASADAWVERAELELVDSAARGGDRALVTQARADADKAIALDDQFARAKVVAAAACLELAKLLPSRSVVERGIAYADQALALNPRLTKAKTVRAALATMSLGR